MPMILWASFRDQQLWERGLAAGLRSNLKRPAALRNP
jgi:hypothetical protein